MAAPVRQWAHAYSPADPASVPPSATLQPLLPPPKPMAAGGESAAKESAGESAASEARFPQFHNTLLRHLFHIVTFLVGILPFLVENKHCEIANTQSENPANTCHGNHTMI